MRYKVLKNIGIDGRHCPAGSIVDLDPTTLGVLVSLVEPVPQDAPQPAAQPCQERPAPAPVPKHVQHATGPNPPPLSRVSLFVTTRCNRHCPLCSQSEFRASGMGDMPADIAGMALDQIAAAGLSTVVSITGGEPCLWPHLQATVERAAGNPRLVGIWLYSNCMDREILDRSLAVDARVLLRTERANCDIAAAEWLQARHGTARVNIAKVGHMKLPYRITFNTLPAVCHCKGVAVTPDGTVWACPNFYSLAVRFGQDVQAYREQWACPVDGGEWIAYWRRHEDEKYGQYLCQACPSNVKIKGQIPDSERTKRYEGDDW